MNWDLFLPTKLVNPFDIECPFSKEEIKTNVFSVPGEKSPSLDGFLLYFYHHFWDLLKEDLLEIFQFLHRSDDIETLKFLNQTFITLIPAPCVYP